VKYATLGTTPLLTTLAMVMVLGLAACSQDTTSDLEAYTKAVLSRQKSKIEPLPEFKPFETYSYNADGLRDPFVEPAVPRQVMPVAQRPNNGLLPDLNRPSEPLEEFPLDSLRMVGTLAKDQHSWALVQSTDDTIHRVQPGNYLGQNYGKITRITENEVELTEIVPDGLGGWMERQASLALSE
jgi:type IV pilus assembly protein PilP